jgi:hypothetical protein
MVKDKMEGRSFKKMLNIISVDLNTGDVIIFDETTPIEKQPTAMMVDHATLADGGLFTQV